MCYASGNNLLHKESEYRIREKSGEVTKSIKYNRDADSITLTRVRIKNTATKVSLNQQKATIKLTEG